MANTCPFCKRIVLVWSQVRRDESCFMACCSDPASDHTGIMGTGDTKEEAIEDFMGKAKHESQNISG